MSSPSPAIEAVPLARRRRWPLVTLLVVLATVPLLTSAIRYGHDWVPQGDAATIVLRGDDLLRAETPLVGMPSTVGASVGEQVHHPGPLESQMIGVVALFSDDARAAVATIAVVNLVSVVVALLWVWRMGGTAALSLAAPVTALFLWSLRGPILATPYNPHAALLPLFACLVSLAAVVDRRRWAGISACVFGSWAAQAHLTTSGPVVAAAGAAALVFVLHRYFGVRDERAGDREPVLRRAVLGFVVLVLLWSFPLVDVVVNGGGNVRAVLRASGALEERTLGAATALDIVVNGIGVRPVWARAAVSARDLTTEAATSQRLSALVLIVVAVAVAWACRRSRPAVTAGVVVAAAAIVAGGVLASKIPDSLFTRYAFHNYVWLWATSVVLWFSTLAGVAHLAADRLDRRPGIRWFALAALVVTSAIGVASFGAPHRDPGTKSTTYARSLTGQAKASLDPDGEYVVDLDSNIALYDQGAGLLFALERADFDVRVPDRYEAAFGRHRVTNEERDTLVVRMGRDEAVPPDDGRLVATYRPSPELLERRSAAERAIVDEITRRGGTDVAGLGRVESSEAAAWVESGGYLNSLSFGFVDPALAALPASDELVQLQREPIDVVTVLLVPAP